MNILPCDDGCGFNKGNCKYLKECGEDVEMGVGIYYYWEKSDIRPVDGDRPKTNKPISLYRKRIGKAQPFYQEE